MNQNAMEGVQGEEFDPLDDYEELELLEGWSYEDSSANDHIREVLVKRNIRFAFSRVLNKQPAVQELPDLFGEAILGLHIAANKFDPKHGVRFISYAVWWVDRMVIEYRRRNYRPIRYPASIWKDLALIRKAETKLYSDFEEITQDSLLKEAGITKDRYDRAMELSAEVKSTQVALPSPLGEKSKFTLEDVIPDKAAYIDEESFLDTTFFLEKVRDSMSDRDYEVLYSYFGLGMSLESIGKKLGVSRERVRQIKDRGMDKAKRVVGRFV